MADVDGLCQGGACNFFVWLLKRGSSCGVLKRGIDLLASPSTIKPVSIEACADGMGWGGWEGLSQSVGVVGRMYKN